VPKAVVQERYERLVELVGEISWSENLAHVGRTVEVMFADGEGRKDAATARLSGRARDNRLVHVAVPEDEALRPRPGDIAEVEITYAAPHHLTADKGLLSLRRTRGGDAWQARRDGVDAPVAAGSVGLGMPGLGVPAPLPPAAACAAG
jgi:tRNA-2-methylthio-N6-dimethylallyladenosine synthase